MAVVAGRRTWVAGLALVLGAACGGGGDEAADDPLLRTGETPVTASPACRDSFSQGHNQESAGGDTPTVFRPSVEACASLAEWTAAARSGHIDLTGRDARFVSEVCRASGDPALQARPICREATEQLARAAP